MKSRASRLLRPALRTWNLSAKLATNQQPRYRNWPVGTADDHQLHLRLVVFTKISHGLVDGRRRDQMIIVENENEGLGLGRYVIYQCAHHRIGRDGYERQLSNQLGIKLFVR